MGKCPPGSVFIYHVVNLTSMSNLIFINSSCMELISFNTNVLGSQGPLRAPSIPVHSALNIWIKAKPERIITRPQHVATSPDQFNLVGLILELELLEKSLGEIWLLMMIFAVYSDNINFGPNILNIFWLIGKFPGKDANISCDMTKQSAGQHFR